MSEIPVIHATDDEIATDRFWHEHALADARHVKAMADALRASAAQATGDQP